MSTENGARGYNTFEQPPPPYSVDSDKNLPPYQGHPQYGSGQYYPMPGGKLFSLIL